MKRVAVVLAVLLVLVLLAEFAAPRIIARGVELGLRRALGVDVTVGLKAYPSLRLLLGQFEELSVVSRGISIGGLQTKEYIFQMGQATINMRELLSRRELNFVRQGAAAVQMTVTQEQLTSFLLENLPHLADWRIEIGDGYAVMLGTPMLGDTSLNILVRGEFASQGRDRISFVPRQVEVQGLLLEPALFNELLSDTQLYIDLSAAPMPLELTSVRMERTRLIIQARVVE